MIILVALITLPSRLLQADNNLSDIDKIPPKFEQIYGKQAKKRASSWQQLIHVIRRQEPPQQLEAVNHFFNQMAFVDDLVVWGKRDYWATPFEFLGAGAGDCEDYSIAKYVSLRDLGIADDKLRLIYVKALQLNQFHMVLAYYPTPASVPLLLDNLNPEIKPATERPDLQPIYSFNGSKLWLMKLRGQGEHVGDASRLKHWNNLRQRFDNQQFAQPRLQRNH